MRRTPDSMRPVTGPNWMRHPVSRVLVLATAGTLAAITWTVLAAGVQAMVGDAVASGDVAMEDRWDVDASMPPPAEWRPAEEASAEEASPGS